jgi:hypothetical protein
MTTAGGLLLPVHVAEVDRESWTSSVTLYRFVCPVRRCCLSSSALRAVLGRATLAIWLGGLKLREFGVGSESLESPGSFIDDKRILGWIVTSVKRGWTPREVLLWVFPSFGGLLFDMIFDESGSA